MTFVLDRALTFEEYLSYDDGTDYRYELVDGRLFIMNPPRGRHGKIIRFLHEQLTLGIKKAKKPWLSCWDTGVRTTKQTVRIPDLVVMTQEQEDSIDNISAVLETPPLLIVEVVSPGAESEERDYEDKRQEYEAIGVAEYWVVDPFAMKVTVYLLVGKRYQAQEYVGKSLIQSAAFPNLVLTAQQVLQG